MYTDEQLFERFSLDPMKDFQDTRSLDEFFSEAVFADGKNTVISLVETIQKIKDLLDEQTNEQDTSTKEAKDAKSKNRSGEDIKVPAIKAFDPTQFWKNNLFKELEDQISKVFGFRNMEVHPYIERYNTNGKSFESKIMNCAIYHSDRFPIEGLITDKGFYDKSKSISMQIHISLGLIKELSAEEILAVLLHEFGHSIDPALVDIKFTEVNVLSKYITDRKNAINKDEKKALEKRGLGAELSIMVPFIILLFCLIGSGISGIIKSIKYKFGNKEKMIDKKMDKIRKLIDNDKGSFDRQNYSEAFADNFARMYGFGPQLMAGLKKMSKDYDAKVKSRYKKEKDRQECILYITENMIKDVHKTDIHRIRNLLKEYKADIDDPNTPPIVKKQLTDDMAELEKVLDEYLNNFSEFQNRVNKVINDELEKLEDKADKTDKSKKVDNTDKDDVSDKKDKVPEKEDAIKEGFEYFDESKEAYEKLIKTKESLTSEERSEVKNKFGPSKACSFGKDKNGYYCFTHRARSKSCKTIDSIPQKDVDFVRSTS